MLIEEPPDDRTDTPDDPVETPSPDAPEAPEAPTPEAPEAPTPETPEEPSAPASPARGTGSADASGSEEPEAGGSSEGTPLVTEGEPTAPEADADADATPEADAASVTDGEDEAPAAAAAEGNGQVEAEAAPAAADPFGGPGDWYVIHTYAGYENKVKTNLESRIHTMQMEEKIFDVHVPMEDVMEIKGGKKQVVQKKVFPGYLLVRMVYDDDSWYVVRNTPGVTGFVSSGTGQKPTPLSRREVEKILAVKEEEAKKPAFRLEFEEGGVVRIISGPFADFNGTISDINVDQSKLRVMVNIFDRETPVELGFDQVAKV
jgi:transcription termination/antitermination protein NusG